MLLLFSRFYNLSYTARFTEDESGFLVRAHQIFVERKLTLVGQINDTGTKVFSSSTVYLLLPFAILGSFDPVSVFYGAAFFGVTTSLVILFLSIKLNRTLFFLSGLLTIFWFPLLETGRWAWNPNFIPLFTALGILGYLSGRRWGYFLSGLFFGLSVHQHYYSIFISVFFIGIVVLEALMKKKWPQFILICSGFVIMLIPFIVFDLRHPPGLFLSGVGGQAQGVSLSLVLPAFFANFYKTFLYYTQFPLLTLFALFLSGLLLILDIVKEKRALLFLIPVFGQIAAVSLIADYFHHYFFPTIPFILVWLFYPRKNKGSLVATSILVIFLVGSLPKFIPHLSTAPVTPDLTTIKEITFVIKEHYQKAKMQNVNITVLASPDTNTFGKRYRDLLLVPDNIHLLTHDQYHLAENLYVVSTETEEVLRKDPAFEIKNFRNGIVNSKWNIDNEWKIYLFTRK